MKVLIILLFSILSFASFSDDVSGGEVVSVDVQGTGCPEHCNDAIYTEGSGGVDEEGNPIGTTGY